MSFNIKHHDDDNSVNATRAALNQAQITINSGLHYYQKSLPNNKFKNKFTYNRRTTDNDREIKRHFLMRAYHYKKILFKKLSQRIPVLIWI